MPIFRLGQPKIVQCVSGFRHAILCGSLFQLDKKNKDDNCDFLSQFWLFLAILTLYLTIQAYENKVSELQDINSQILRKKVKIFFIKFKALNYY